MATLENEVATGHIEYVDGDYVPAVQAPGRRRGKKRRDLSLLPEVPMDVLLEILILLDPKDLLTMSRASKDFRKALVNDTMNRVIWKVKREESGAPAGPPGWSEAKWVSFLFNSFCYSCATPNVVTEFMLMKRLCVACKKDNYLAESDANPEYAGLLEFVPMTCYAPSSSKEPSDERYCWTPDFAQVINAWNYIWDLIEGGQPAAREALEAYKERQLDLVNWINQTAAECYGWAEALQEQRQLDKASINERRAQIVRLHFYELGYEQVDVDLVVDSDSPEVCGKTANITKRVWNNIRAKLEPQVVEAREARLFGVRCELFNTRADMFSDIWSTWLNSLNLSTAEGLTYPWITYVTRLPAVSDLMHGEVDVTVEDFEPIVSNFPSMVTEFWARKKAELRGMIPLESISQDSPDPLELATSVFRPPTNCYTPVYNGFQREGIVIGWKQHSIIHGWTSDYEASQYGWEVKVMDWGTYNSELSKIAAFLVELCGRNPLTTTAEDMDRLDMRFMCRQCLNGALRRRYGYRLDLDGEVPATRVLVQAYTWRAALSHFHSHFGCESSRPFRLLDEYLQDARDAEAEALPRILRELPAWFCNHCALGGGQSLLRADVFRHLIHDHGIRDRREGVDYFFNEVYRNKLEEPCSIQVTYERRRVDV